MPRILIIAPAWVGDTVMAQPLLMRLKARSPQTRIEVLAAAWVAPILARMPEVDATLDNPFGHGELKLAQRLRLARSLKSRGYDQAIVLPNSLKSALVPFFAGIPRRTGFVGEGRFGLLNDLRRLDAAAHPLLAERFALLAEPPGAALSRPLPMPRLTVDQARAQATLARLGLRDDAEPIAFCPGAEYGPAKRWPAHHFARLAHLLTAKGHAVWLLGSPRDAHLGAAIAAASTARNLCGKTTLDEAVDLLAHARAVVSNDSGLMHVAAAVGTPLVALYGSSSPGFTPPLSPAARILSLGLACSPCFERACPLGHLDCLEKLVPEAVQEALTTLLARPRDTRPGPAGA
ncbi:lipopolysaccharide heptosyltransferase II [Thiobacter aerophilum]|uniref:lipopolysaccharide heptosyltransferase II n=1 Tax=Thiobacter aerophilum TaxID=3121275 RepID=A0ABV0EBM6_9BURK